jgi:hypothetical protein
MSNIIQDGSFEFTASKCTLSKGTNYCSVPITKDSSWQSSSGEIEVNKGILSLHGRYWVDLNTKVPITISQMVSLEPGKYSLSFWLSKNECGAVLKTGSFGVEKVKEQPFETDSIVWRHVSLEFSVETSQEYEVFVTSTSEGNCGPGLDTISLILMSSADEDAIKDDNDPVVDEEPAQEPKPAKPAPTPSPPIPSPKTVPIKPTAELTATDFSKEAASVPQDSPTITSSITPTTAFESINQAAEDPSDLDNGSPNQSRKDIIVASALTSVILILILALFWWKHKRNGLAKSKEESNLDNSLKLPHVKAVRRASLASSGTWHSLFSIPSASPFSTEKRLHRVSLESRKSRSTMLFSPAIEEKELPSQKFFNAVMDYEPRKQEEIDIIAGDLIEVLEMKSERCVRVVNRSTFATGVVPVSVIGAEIVRDEF